jgi:regulator of protease activity HflC (stomatin/prohibitin superfamily)
MTLKQTLLISVVLCISVLTGCTRIGPGHAGIVVNSAGSDKGVSQMTASTGWFFFNPFNETVIEYQTAQRLEKWTQNPDEGQRGNQEVSFTNKDQMVIYADVAIAFSLDASKVPAFYVKFLAHDEDDLDAKFTNGFLKNQVRNCLNDTAGQYDIHQLMGDNAEFLKKTQNCIQDVVKQWGVTIDQFGLIGAPRPPQTVIDAINEKSRAEQVATKKQIELIQVQADAAKQVAEAEGNAKATLLQAEAQAQANQKLAASLSESLIRYRAIDKWDGHRPQVEGNGGGLLLQVK